MSLLLTVAAMGCADDDGADGDAPASSSAGPTSSGPTPGGPTSDADTAGPGTAATTTVPGGLASEADVEAWFLDRQQAIGQQIIDMGQALEVIGPSGLDPAGCQHAVDVAVGLYESDVVRDPAVDLTYLQVVETFGALASECVKGDEENVRTFAATMVLLLADFNTWAESLDAPPASGAPTDAGDPTVVSAPADVSAPTTTAAG